MDRPILDARRLAALQEVCLAETARLYPTEAERNAMIARVVDATTDIAQEVGAPAFLLVVLMDLETIAEKIEALYRASIQ